MMLPTSFIGVARTSILTLKTKNYAFHHSITECLRGILGASVLFPVTPNSSTGCRGRKDHRMYGSQSQGGSPLWEIWSAWGILYFRQLLLRYLLKSSHVSIDYFVIPNSPAWAGR